jgi:hypothetical protein
MRQRPASFRPTCWTCLKGEVRHRNRMAGLDMKPSSEKSRRYWKLYAQRPLTRTPLSSSRCACLAKSSTLSL